VVHTGIVFVLMTAVAAWAVAENAAKDDRAATQELMRSVVPKAAYQAILEQTYAQMSATLQQTGGKPIPASKQKALREAVAECMSYEDVVSWSTDVYLKHFTRKEIDDLAAFSRTPTGKKAAATLPILTGEIGAVMAPLMMTRMPAALKKRNFEI
jgi:uncharacterized protein